MLALNYKNVSTITALLQSALADAAKLDSIMKLRGNGVCDPLDIGTLHRSAFNSLRVEVDMLSFILSKDEKEEEV